MEGTVVSKLRSERNLGSSPRIGWERISIGKNVVPIGFEKEEAYLELILRNTVLGDAETGIKRSNSLLVYGIPGSGKTTLIESTLAKMDKHVPDFIDSRLIVRLSGLLCPDFRNAVEGICHQLKLDDPFKDDESEDDSQEDNAGKINLTELENARTFDDRLHHVMEFLRTEMTGLNKSIIFVLDRLDLFAEHPNQHLLYNLYDLAANSKNTVPICIIGVTDRVDVLEMFEKRVKSRFSHRNINLCPTYGFEKYKEITQRLLSFHQQSTDGNDKGSSRRSVAVNPQNKWNSHVATLVQQNRVQQILRSVFDADPTILKLSTFLFSVLISVRDEVTVQHFEQAFEENVQKLDPLRVVFDLSVTELLVLLSVYKQLQTKNLQAWQPSNLYRIVEKIMKSLGQGREDYFKGMAKLESLRLIIPVSTSQRSQGGVNNIGDIFYKSELTFSELREIWGKHPSLPSSFREFL